MQLRDKAAERILITGSKGYIGTHLLGHFYDPNSVIECDVQDGMDFASLSGCEFDAVVHLAAWASIIRSLDDPDGCLDNNGFKLIPFLTNNKVGKLIFTSTGGAIYGERKVPAKEEEASWNGCVSPYAQSKYIGEQIIRRMCPNHVILRLGNVFGGNDSVRAEASALTCFHKDNPIIVYGGKQTRDFVSVDVVCKAIIHAIHSDITGTFNIGTGEAKTIGDIAEDYGKQRGVPVEYRPVRPGEITDVALDTSKAKAAGIIS
jgi:UDP-glucose 4-epimerase